MGRNEPGKVAKGWLRQRAIGQAERNQGALQNGDRSLEQQCAQTLLARVSSDKRFRSEAKATLDKDRTAVTMHNLHSEGALRTAIKVAARAVASCQEHHQMWLRPFFWSFKDAKGNVGPIAEYRAAYGPTVARRRKAQVEQWPWGEQDPFDEVDEACRTAAEALAERAAAVMQKHGR